jgi:carbon-monoxide dehydrogenase medium subunit
VAGVARHVANVRVRSVGTVGGNLAFADPHSDLATLFLTFDARIVLWSARGAREIALADFVLGPYETAREADEIVTAVRLGQWPAGAAGAYLKFGVHERPTLGVAAMLALDPARERVAAARVAIGCVGPTPRRLTALEDGLRGLATDAVPAAADDLVARVSEGIDTISDLHGAAD